MRCRNNSSNSEVCFLSEAEIYHDYGISPLIETFEEIKQDFSEQVFLKAVEDRYTIGSMRSYLEKETSYIRLLSVISECQNKGIGTMLMHQSSNTLHQLIVINCLLVIGVLGIYISIKNLAIANSNEYL